MMHLHISLAIVLLLSQTLPVSAQLFSSSKPIAVVNGQPLPRAEWEAAVKKLPAPPANISPEARKGAAMQVLALMIDDVLLRQFLSKQVPAPSAAEVQSRLTQLETALRNNKKTLADYYRETGLDEAKLKAGIAAETQWQTYLARRLSQEDLKKYYTDNKDMFDGAKIRVAHIVYTIPPGDAKLEAAGKEYMDKVRLQLLQGADFAGLAKQYSHDKTSAERGGDLGWFPPRKADTDQFIRTASGMKKGEVSGLVRTEYGLHIIQIADFQPGKTSSFEEVKESVKDVYADELKVNIILQQRRDAKIEVND
jgi:parvulin-like peptidyl-prolyl isomerase